MAALTVTARFLLAPQLPHHHSGLPRYQGTSNGHSSDGLLKASDGSSRVAACLWHRALGESQFIPLQCTLVPLSVIFDYCPHEETHFLPITVKDISCSLFAVGCPPLAGAARVFSTTPPASSSCLICPSLCDCSLDIDFEVLHT